MQRKKSNPFSLIFDKFIIAPFVTLGNVLITNFKISKRNVFFKDDYFDK